MILRGFFQIELHLGFDTLERYLTITEEYLQKAEKDFDTHVDEQVKQLIQEGIPPNEIDDINESYGEQHWDYAETFPGILRNSFFVSAYSLLEHKMALFCSWLKKDNNISKDWSELRGSTLDKFKSYCKLAHLTLDYTDQNWEEINYYRIVRNCIVHNRGLIKGAKQRAELYDYASSKNIIQDLFVGLSVRSQLQIVLTENFCQDVTKTIWAFLNNVLQAYELQRQQRKVNEGIEH